ncbi:FIST signal transduction protein [Legionella waltersii]|uniref:FIST N domain protein n=1 Tax=Legionella waltersii TaxID=66969 RepID=A0A0W1A186_9GAMM|nr:FIST N-terminal domain-containing protein [Legionella waltersii]KTD74985.1 FIST N domain protein [Legionella waltersii]SNV08296.1 Uncharacterized conserved protein [Legionella waltersii]
MKIEKNLYLHDLGWKYKHNTQLDSKQTLIVFFGSQMLKDAPIIAELKQAFPQSQIIGCSTAGEILNGEVYDESLTYVVMQFERTQFFIETLADYREKNLVQIGQHVADKLYNKDLVHVFMLSSGFNMNIDDFILGFKKNSGREIPISGGVAADGENFTSNWIYHNGFHDSGILCLGLYGDSIQVSSGCEGGWVKFGLERKITKSTKNILYEIDAEPALEVYKRYLGHLASKLPSSGLLFPLAIRKNTESLPVVRTILAINEDDKSIIFAGEIPQGWFASLMRCTNEGLIDGARKAFVQSNSNSIEPSVSIMISCIGRRMVLGARSFNELNSMHSSYLENKHIDIGFYSYGEICEKKGIDSKLHNQTMTISTLYELNDDQIT